MKILSILSFFLIYSQFYSQELNNLKKRVLFIGNSYTGVNNLPELIRIIALSVSDTLIYDSNTPGGQTFEGHCSDVNTLQKIAQGTWDFVVLQEQSQRPSFPENQVINEVYPFAKKLDSLILAANSCTETIFYMTWGRKNGDSQNCQFFPPLCTYEGMDSLLFMRYMAMTNNNQAIVSPVGKLWNYIRKNYPEIELYSSDESHPSLAGSYAAACSFYSTIFRKNPLLISENVGMDAIVAQTIRQAAKIVVFDSLINWKVGEYDPKANFNYIIGTNNEVSFFNQSINFENFSWSFGNGMNSSELNPIEAFENGTYEIVLVAEKCGISDTIRQTMIINDASLSENEITFQLYPNPVNNIININSDFVISNVSITDFKGKVCENILVNKNSISLNTKNLDKGIYSITLTFVDGSVQFGKFIIN